MGFKNIISIELDTESEEPIIISKPDTVKQPETVQETIDMMSIDFKTLCVAISEMAFIGHANGYFDGKQVLDTCIEELNEVKKHLEDDNGETT